MAAAGKAHKPTARHERLQPAHPAHPCAEAEEGGFQPSERPKGLQRPLGRRSLLLQAAAFALALDLGGGLARARTWEPDTVKPSDDFGPELLEKLKRTRSDAGAYKPGYYRGIQAAIDRVMPIRVPGADDALVSDIVAMIRRDPDLGPGLVRLGFHSSGTYDKISKTGGSSKGTIRFKQEMSTEANAGIQKILERLEPLKETHPETSYADLYTLVGAVAVEALGGPKIDWKGGRVDSFDPKDAAPDGRLPDPDKGTPKKTIEHLHDIFSRMGFDDREMVALSGAHTLGECHYDASGYVGFWSFVPLRFDNSYYSLLLQPVAFKESLEDQPGVVRGWLPHTLFGKLQYRDPFAIYMMLPSDLALVQDPKTLKYVEEYANNNALFRKDFAAAYGKMLALGTK